MVAMREKQATRIARLERDIKALKARVGKPQATTFTVKTFAPEPIVVIKPIPVVVRGSNDNYVASFVDANINASGDTDVDAVTALMDYMVGYFKVLCDLPSKQLGPGPKRQLAVLKEFIKPR